MADLFPTPFSALSSVPGIRETSINTSVNSPRTNEGDRALITWLWLRAFPRGGAERFPLL